MSIHSNNSDSQPPPPDISNTGFFNLVSQVFRHRPGVLLHHPHPRPLDGVDLRVDRVVFYAIVIAAPKGRRDRHRVGRSHGPRERAL